LLEGRISPGTDSSGDVGVGVAEKSRKQQCEVRQQLASEAPVWVGGVGEALAWRKISGAALQVQVRVGVSGVSGGSGGVSGSSGSSGGSSGF
jgi:hypothetical protein